MTTARIGSYTHLVFEGENLVGIAKNIDERDEGIFGTVLFFGSGSAVYIEFRGYRTLSIDEASEDVIAEADYLLEAA